MRGNPLQRRPLVELLEERQVLSTLSALSLGSTLAPVTSLVEAPAQAPVEAPITQGLNLAVAVSVELPVLGPVSTSLGVNALAQSDVLGVDATVQATPLVEVATNIDAATPTSLVDIGAKVDSTTLPVTGTVEAPGVGVQLGVNAGATSDGGGVTLGGGLTTGGTTSGVGVMIDPTGSGVGVVPPIVLPDPGVTAPPVTIPPVGSVPDLPIVGQVPTPIELPPGVLPPGTVQIPVEQAPVPVVNQTTPLVPSVNTTTNGLTAGTLPAATETIGLPATPANPGVAPEAIDRAFTPGPGEQIPGAVGLLGAADDGALNQGAEDLAGLNNLFEAFLTDLSGALRTLQGWLARVGPLPWILMGLAVCALGCEYAARRRRLALETERADLDAWLHQMAP